MIKNSMIKKNKYEINRIDTYITWICKEHRSGNWNRIGGRNGRKMVVNKNICFNLKNKRLSKKKLIRKKGQIRSKKMRKKLELEEKINWNEEE